MSFFTSPILRPLDHSAIAQKAPAVFAQEPKSTTSDRYLFIPTHKMVDGLLANGWSVVAASQQGNAGTTATDRLTNKHALFFARSESLGSEFKQGDVLPLLKLENSHNALSSFNLTTGFFRKACANGLTVPESIFAAPKIRHTNDMKDLVIEASYKVLKDFPKLAEMQQKLSSIELNNEERLLLADTAAQVFFDKEEIERQNALAAKAHFRFSRPIGLDAQLITPRRYEDRKNDLWTVTNVIQENVIRGNVQVANEKNKLVHKRKVTSIDRDNDIHDKLFAMAKKFAELKGVSLTA